MTRILIVDDEPQLLRALVLNLTSRGYDVTTANTAAAAIERTANLPPDIVILDLGLPDRDGLTIIRELRGREPTLPIVVLSARSGSRDKVTALDLGAVDYVTKPFDMNELIARLRAASRRADASTVGSTITIGDNEINVANKSACHHDGSPIHLTPTEWRILDVLLRHPGRLISARDLLIAIRRDPDHTESSYLRIYLAQLRRNLEPIPNRPRHLVTEPGMGYRYLP